MLNNSLSELPIIALTRSDRVLDICLRDLTANNKSSKLTNNPSQQQFKQAIKESLFDMRAHQLRWDDIDNALEKHWQADKGDATYSLKCLQTTAVDYLNFEGDHFAVKADLTTEYQALINHLHPGFLIAGYFVKQLKARQWSINALPALLKKQCPLGFAANDETTPFADNHVHFGGVHGTDVLTRFLFDRVDRKQLKDLKLPRVPEFTLINSDNYNVGTLVSVYRLLFDVYCDYSFAKADKQPELLKKLPQLLKSTLKQSPLNSNNSRLYTKVRLNKKPTTPQQMALFEMVKQVQQGNSHQALTAMACALLLQLEEKQQPAAIQTVTLALVHLVNILRAYVVMSGVGLSHFVDFFMSDIRQFKAGSASKESSTSRESLAWLLAGNNKAALKVAPPTENMDWLAKTAHLVDWQNQQFHYCLHFIRDHIRKLRAGMDDEKRREVNHQGQQLRRLLKSQRRYKSNMQVPTLIRGFDVAGNENHFPIHLFAPALRYLREKPIAVKKLNGTVQLSKHRYLSIHAGEDYSHLITGLRAIDETVYYCNMRQGDRLGHALALGVMPKDWAERQQQAFVTPEENLWNTVWLLHYAIKLSIDHNEALRMVPQLERRLQNWQKDHFNASFTHAELSAYWQSRGNSYQHQQWFNNSKNLHDSAYWVPFEHSDRLQAKFPTIRSALRALSKDEKDSKKIDFAINLTTDKNNTELLLYQLIQDHLMMKYDRRGIIIEACPSSNISLSRFDDYHQHPIFRWFPPDDSLFESKQLDRFGIRNKGEVAVCINTDDPGIFPTNIEQEYRLLRHAAKHHYGLSSQTADLWIERLRKLSLRAFGG